MSARVLAAIALFAPPLGCGGSHQPSLGVPRAGASTAGAVIDVAAGAILYVAAGGCKIAGCPVGLVCNPQSERCDKIPCGVNGCPFGTSCEPSTDTCMSTGGD